MAFIQLMKELPELAKRSAEDSLKTRVSPGGYANLLLDELQSGLDSIG